MADKLSFNDVKNLIDDLEKGERHYRGYKEAGDVARRVAGLLQAEEEANARIAKARADETDILSAIDKNLTKADAEAEAVNKAIAEAKDKAKAVLENAKKEASDIVSIAKVKAEEAKESYRADLDLLAKNIADKLAELAQINSELKKAFAEKESFEKTMEDNRKRLKDLLG